MALHMIDRMKGEESQRHKSKQLELWNKSKHVELKSGKEEKGRC